MPNILDNKEAIHKIMQKNPTGVKSDRVKSTFSSAEFWINCHILAGFGDLFFIPAFTWIQIDNGRRASLMLEQVTKWLVLLKDIQKRPDEYFTKTLEHCVTLNICKHTVLQCIKNFAKECHIRIAEYFQPWFQPPLLLATINNHTSAKVLLQQIYNAPDEFDLHGFNTGDIFKEFLSYVGSDNAELKSFPSLHQWYACVFGTCVVHNIDCERAFSVMRYITHTKINANETLKSSLMQQSLGENLSDIQNADLYYCSGVLQQLKLDENDVQSDIDNDVRVNMLVDQLSDISQFESEQRNSQNIYSTTPLTLPTIEKKTPIPILLQTAVNILLQGVQYVQHVVASVVSLIQVHRQMDDGARVKAIQL